MAWPLHRPSHTMSEPSLRILLVDQNADRAAILEEGLRDAGCRDITIVREMHSLMRRILEVDPDVIFIDLENPNRDVLEQMFQVSRSVRRPIAMFVDQADTESIHRAVQSGVGAYVVDGLHKDRVKTILDTAVGHFNTFNQLREELERANQALEDRKLIERAKGILMKERGVNESDAYGLLRTAAMNENRRIIDVARGVVSAAGLMK
jgi:two-component system, response regulator / RNA-binding antiterminator